MSHSDSITHLVTILTDIHSPSQMKAFLQAFLSDTEQSVLARRLAILIQLRQGKSYEEISRDLKVSSATISAIATVKDLPITRKVLLLLKRDQQLNQLLGI